MSNNKRNAAKNSALTAAISAWGNAWCNCSCISSSCAAISPDLEATAVEPLDAWIEAVQVSQIPELQRFVIGMVKDKDAVVAGLTLAYRNGLVEGKVNKLKLIKRMGYGRAGFPLLRQRVLHAL